jgi:D-alanyl-D-alanine carboxypeptidase
MRNFLFMLSLLCLVKTPAVASTLPESVSAALKHAHIPLSSVSVVVQETGAPEHLFSLNADRAINPASTMKLLTTIASLETLGPRIAGRPRRSSTANWKTACCRAIWCSRVMATRN